jgi:hypothetical protein
MEKQPEFFIEELWLIGIFIPKLLKKKDYHKVIMPPSTIISSPMIYELSEEAKNTATLAIS